MAEGEPLKGAPENWVGPPGLEILSSTFPSAERESDFAVYGIAKAIP